MSLVLKCDVCSKKAEKDEDAVLWVMISPAIGQGNGHACSESCAKTLTARIRNQMGKVREQIIAGKAQDSGLTVVETASKSPYLGGDPDQESR
jgi:hypothetical protein